MKKIKESYNEKENSNKLDFGMLITIIILL